MKTRAASERRTYIARLASQNKNIVAMIKIAMAFRSGSITDNLDCNSECSKLAFILKNSPKIPHLGSQAEPTEDLGHRTGKSVFYEM
jgi:hypothetical protein